ncbi:unnamed protein product, partial [Brenthis ino]
MKPVICTVLLVTVFCVVFAQEDCITPTKVDGTCLPITQCKNLKPQKSLTAEERESIKQWHCGFEGEIPKVCCPPESITISPIEKVTSTTSSPKPAYQKVCATRSGTFGFCVRLALCPKLSQMVTRATKEDLEFVQRSRCTGDAPYSVCCDTFETDNAKDRFAGQLQKCTTKVSPFDLKPPCCGTESTAGNKIIGGTPTSLDQYPWLTIIEYTRPYLCGGTLISSLYVLTAAHCLVTTTKASRGAKSVRLGEYNTTNSGPDCIEVEGDGEDCTNGTISIPIATTIVHENYGSDQNIYHSNDIALIKLAEMASYTDFIHPICLPTSDITQRQPDNLRFVVAGWGAVNETFSQSDVKLHTTIPYVNQEHCREKVYKRGGASVIWDKQMCAGGELNKDSCKGDSGGPLIYAYEKYQEIVGVISFGFLQCGNDGQPSIYTRVYDYLEWIKDNTKP